MSTVISAERIYTLIIKTMNQEEIDNWIHNGLLDQNSFVSLSEIDTSHVDSFDHLQRKQEALKACPIVTMIRERHQSLSNLQEKVSEDMNYNHFI